MSLTNKLINLLENKENPKPIVPRKCPLCDKSMRSNATNKFHVKCYDILCDKSYFEDWFNSICDAKGNYYSKSWLKFKTNHRQQMNDLNKTHNEMIEKHKQLYENNK